MPSRRSKQRAREIASLNKRIKALEQKERLFSEKIDGLMPTGSEQVIKLEHDRNQVVEKLRNLRSRKGRLQGRSPGAETGQPRFEFANRKDELKELKALNSIAFYHIHAPAGYGKTHLLLQLQKEFKKKWATAWLSFDNRLSGAEEARSSPIDALAELLKSVGARPTGKIEADLNILARKLTSEASRGSQAQVMLFIDAIEQADPKVRGWIAEDLIPDLRRRATICEVRAFISSRFKIDLKLGEGYKHYQLSPFGLQSLGEVISIRDPQQNIPPKNRERIAQNLRELCLGHPKCVYLILNHIGSPYGFDADGRFLEQSTIFEKIVKPVIHEEILSEAQKIVEINALKTVFTLRRVTPSDLVELFPKDRSLALYGITSLKPCQDFVFFRLLKTGLFSPPISPNPGYVADPVVRHVLTMELAIDETSRLQELHTNAQRIFETRMKGTAENQPKGTEQIPLIVEALYHLARKLMALKQAPAQNLQMIRDTLKEWRTAWQPGDDMRPEDYLSDLRRMISEDIDLPLLLQMILDSDGYHAILACIGEP